MPRNTPRNAVGGAAGAARGGPGAAVLRGLGEVLLTLGAVLVLFAVYSVWWTDVVADHEAGLAGARLRDGWSAPGPAPAPLPAPSATTGGGADRAPDGAGDGVGFLHVPALGDGYQVLIRMGTDPETLAEGVAGVYTQPYRSAMPWEEHGNFALAAHRDGHGAKFHNLHLLRQGDALVVETRENWYVYRVDAVLGRTSPDDTGVIAPVPVGSPYTAPGRYITLTTCTPMYTSRYRMAVWGSLVRVQAVDAGRTPPAELTDGGR